MDDELDTSGRHSSDGWLLQRGNLQLQVESARNYCMSLLTRRKVALQRAAGVVSVKALELSLIHI